MPSAPLLLSSQGVRLGPVRFTLYGLCATAGVIAGMAVASRAARRLRLSSEQTWDVGFFAIVSCFIASRLLLVLGDAAAFLRYPVLVLSLPSLTLGGMALAGLTVMLYARRKRLPLRGMLDAFAPAGAVLAAFLELGHSLDGSEPGMPVFRGPAHAIAFLWPVAPAGVAAAGLLALVLWHALGRAWRPGRVAAAGLALGGAAAFALACVSLPSDLFVAWLEPGEMVALLSMLAGALLWTFC